MSACSELSEFRRSISKPLVVKRVSFWCHFGIPFTKDEAVADLIISGMNRYCLEQLLCHNVFRTRNPSNTLDSMRSAEMRHQLRQFFFQVFNYLWQKTRTSAKQTDHFWQARLQLQTVHISVWLNSTQNVMNGEGKLGDLTFVILASVLLTPGPYISFLVI